MYTILVCVLGILGTTIGGARYTRDTEAESCNQEELLEEVEKCASSAYATYTSAWAKGDDGSKADFYARKSCNYITETIEDCSDILKDCMDEEQLDSYKDEQYKNALGNIQANIESWDSDKCPAVKRHNDRLSASETEKASEDAITSDEDKATEEDKVAEGDNASEQEQSTGEENQEESAGEDNEEPTAGATSLTVSILSTLVLAWLL